VTADTPGPPSGKRVAVMQPYFLPYAGYFRLFQAVDEFVIYDCVQFPRRGRVHRTEVPGPGGGTEWLTLPLARQPRETRIMDLRFAPDARSSFDERLAHLSWIRSARGPAAGRILEYLHGPLDDVVGFLERGLSTVCDLLDIPFEVTRSSSLALDPSLRGQERVLAVASARRATTYVNAPGGIELYDPDAFLRRGIDLRFLTPYEGPHRMLLPALLTVDPASIAADVRATSRLLGEPTPIT
jgi:WbqC-like protein family